MEQQDKRKTFLYQLFVESISDKQHYIIHIIMDLISLLNLLCVTIVIKVKWSMAAVNKVCPWMTS